MMLAFELEPAVFIDEDPLKWWFDRKGKWPRLFSLAMRKLSAQATEVPCERLFSTAGHTFSQYRKSMQPSTLARFAFRLANHPTSSKTVRRHIPRRTATLMMIKFSYLFLLLSFFFYSSVPFFLNHHSYNDSLP
jgi:hypothetical protein